MRVHTCHRQRVAFYCSMPCHYRPGPCLLGFPLPESSSFLIGAFTLGFPVITMRVLVIGKGAREHALAWKLTDQDNSVFVVPGNGGTALMEPRVRNIDHDMFDFPGLVELSKKLAIDLVIPGPDDVVAEGIADAFDQGASAQRRTVCDLS